VPGEGGASSKPDVLSTGRVIQRRSVLWMNVENAPRFSQEEGIAFFTLWAGF
jgi:hypothetical protein